jgi:hypothetical protein
MVWRGFGLAGGEIQGGGQLQALPTLTHQNPAGMTKIEMLVKIAE